MESATGGGGMVQAGLAGEEQEDIEQWSGICVGALVGGGEVQ